MDAGGKNGWKLQIWQNLSFCKKSRNRKIPLRKSRILKSENKKYCGMLRKSMKHNQWHACCIMVSPGISEICWRWRGRRFILTHRRETGRWDNFCKHTLSPPLNTKPIDLHVLFRLIQLKAAWSRPIEMLPGTWHHKLQCIYIHDMIVTWTKNSNSCNFGFSILMFTKIMAHSGHSSVCVHHTFEILLLITVH